MNTVFKFVRFYITSSDEFEKAKLNYEAHFANVQCNFGYRGI